MKTESGLADMAGIKHIHMDRDEYAQHPRFTDEAAFICGLMLMVASAIAMIWCFTFWPLQTVAVACATAGCLFGLHVALRVIEP